MILVAAALGGMGLVCMLYRRTLLGLLIGVQLLALGATMIFVLAGASSGSLIQGHVFGLFITLGGIAHLVVGYALAVRLFYLKRRAGMDELRYLKH
jgi:NADH:ubiquinone oxidoreductase subunit K